VFDTNGHSKLTSADAAFSFFKVRVTLADGTIEARTLDELNIPAINLDPDATHIELPDGSVVTGQAEYTKMVGEETFTGIVANTTLSAEAQGHAVSQTITTGAGGSKTTTTKAYDAGGNLAYAITSTSNSTGTLVNTSYDDNGDGTVDRLQEITTTTVSGVKTELEENYVGNTKADAVFATRQQTVTSADGKEITISRDSTGGGWWDSKEVRTTHTDGRRTVTKQELAPDGTTIIRSTSEAISIDGLTRTETRDLDGDTDADAIISHVITLAGNGTRTEVVATRNGDAGATLRDRTEIVTSADGKARTTSFDADGDTDWDTIDITDLSLDSSGNSTSIHEVRNGDGTTPELGSLRFKTLFTQSADALDVTKSYDMDGDGTYDVTTHDKTTFNAGERTAALGLV
jgi:hypothetical protein